MIWTSPAEFFAMGGYGPYVWGSVVVSLTLIGFEWFLISQRRRTVLSRLKRELIIRKEY